MARDVQLNIRVTAEAAALAHALQEHYSDKVGFPVSLPSMIERLLRDAAERERIVVKKKVR